LLLAAALALLSTSARTVRPEVEAYAHAAQLHARGHWTEEVTFLQAELPKYEGADLDEVWAMRALYGQALTARGRFADALKVLAPPLPRRLASSVVAVRWRSFRAIALNRNHQMKAAQADLDHAERIARKYQPQVLDEVLKWRANFAVGAGRNIEAEEYVRRALRLAKHYQHRQTEAELLATRAIVQSQMRHYDEAIDTNIRVLSLATELHADSLIEKSMGNLSWSYSEIGDFENVKFYAGAALALAEQLGAARDMLPWLNQLADVERLHGNYSTALNYYRRSVAIAREQKHKDSGEYLGNLAVAQLETGDVNGSRRSVEEAMALDRDAENEDEELRASIIAARIDASEGKLQRAIEKTDRVLMTAKHTLRRMEAHAWLGQFCDSAGRPTEAEAHYRDAIALADRARLDITREENRLPFGALVRDIYDHYVAFLLAGRRVEEALQVTEESRTRTLEEAVDQKIAARPIDARRLARERQAVVLSYWLTPKQSYVWIITPAWIRVLALSPSATIERAIDQYSIELQSLRGGQQMRADGLALYRLLIQPVSKRIPDGARVIIIPDGRLHGFNLESLIDPMSHYWIESVTVETAGSLALLNKPPLKVDSGWMLLIGDPPSPAVEFPRLLKAAEELDFVQRRFAPACTTLTGSRATPRAYRAANAGEAGYIHFVAHGIASRLRPLESAVVLANDGDSYKLYARDIIKQKLHARLVTISSCHGAGTRAYTGEGLVGLAWAFLHAGAHQVIAALWEVNDNATPKLMDDLYAGIRAGQDPATALRNAKLNLIRGRSVFRQPRYWAPFVLYSGS
jgi:CHAT domain-containing protein